MSGLAEEAPAAYKDVSRVVEVVHGLGIGRKVANLLWSKDRRPRSLMVPLGGKTSLRQPNQECNAVRAARSARSSARSRIDQKGPGVVSLKKVVKKLAPVRA